MITLQELSFLGFGSVVTALISYGLGVYRDKQKKNEEKNDKREEQLKEDEANVKIASIEILPNMMEQYNLRIKSLEDSMERQSIKMDAQIARMEREALRMQAYLVQLHTDYMRALQRADYCDTIISPLVHNWRPHTLPGHERIPSFEDPPTPQHSGIIRSNSAEDENTRHPVT